MSSFPRGSGGLLGGATRNQQLAVLAALGSVSVFALYVWYQKRQQKLARAAEAAEERKKEERKKEALLKALSPESAEAEKTSSGGGAAAEGATAAGGEQTAGGAGAGGGARRRRDTGSEENASDEPPAKKKEVVMVDARPQERNLSSSNSSDDLSDTDSHSAKSSGEEVHSEAEFEGEEPATLKPAAGTLQLDVCESFSWAEDVERSYSEALAREKQTERARLEAAGYEGAESPGVASQGSEDSGRATGGLASSLSPLDDAANSVQTTPNGTLADMNPMYEFEIPNSLVGLVIGVKGKTIKELSTRTDVRMLIRQHHAPEKVETHQICQVRGTRDKINRCLQMLRKRFPPARFPELNLQPVLPPVLPNNLADLLNTQPSWLTLPESVPCEVAIVNSVDPGHLFVQQPTHPSYSSLSLLDQYMIRLYSQTTGIPELPMPCDNGLLCAAPVMSAWFRAVTVMYFPEEDEVLVRFVDYGGYNKIARKELKQIRTDLMTLPFQATECFLAHVQPVDGTSCWSMDACNFFRDLVSNKVVYATLIGYTVDERVPVIEIELEKDGKRVRVDRLLMEAGYAKASDPSKVQKVGQVASKSRSRHTSMAA